MPPCHPAALSGPDKAFRQVVRRWRWDALIDSPKGDLIVMARSIGYHSNTSLWHAFPTENLP
jgi:hypothetical protein